MAVMVQFDLSQNWRTGFSWHGSYIDSTCNYYLCPIMYNIEDHYIYHVQISANIMIDTELWQRLPISCFVVISFYSFNPSMYYSIAITVMEKFHVDIHPRKKEVRF